LKLNVFGAFILKASRLLYEKFSSKCSSSVGHGMSCILDITAVHELII